MPLRFKATIPFQPGLQPTIYGLYSRPDGVVFLWYLFVVVLIGSQRKSDAMLHVPVKNKKEFFFNMKKHDTFQTRGSEGGARKAEEVVTFRLGAVAKGRRAVPGVPLASFLR